MVTETEPHHTESYCTARLIYELNTSINVSSKGLNQEKKLFSIYRKTNTSLYLRNNPKIVTIRKKIDGSLPDICLVWWIWTKKLTIQSLDLVGIVSTEKSSRKINTCRTIMIWSARQTRRDKSSQSLWNEPIPVLFFNNAFIFLKKMRQQFDRAATMTVTAPCASFYCSMWPGSQLLKSALI